MAGNVVNSSEGYVPLLPVGCAQDNVVAAHHGDATTLNITEDETAQLDLLGFQLEFQQPSSERTRSRARSDAT